MKELKCLKYYTGGGFGDHRDIRNTAIELTMSRGEIYCLCSAVIGNKSIVKTFTNKEYPILNDVVGLLNKVDFENIGIDIDRAMTLDIPSIRIEYSYENYDELKVLETPNNKGLLSLLNDFLNNYLLKDNELQAIFKAIIDSNNDSDYMGLKYIVKNDKIFDINKEYDLYTLSVSQFRPVENNKTINSDNKVSVDDLIGEIDKRLEDIDKM